MTVGLYIPQIVLKYKNCEGLSFDDEGGILLKYG